MQTPRLNLDRHEFMLTSDNVVLGHFSNRELAVFTAAQRYKPRKAMVVNGEKIANAELILSLVQYQEPDRLLQDEGVN